MLTNTARRNPSTTSCSVTSECRASLAGSWAIRSAMAAGEGRRYAGTESRLPASAHKRSARPYVRITAALRRNCDPLPVDGLIGPLDVDRIRLGQRLARGQREMNVQGIGNAGLLGGEFSQIGQSEGGAEVPCHGIETIGSEQDHLCLR